MLDRTLAPRAHGIQGMSLIVPEMVTFENGIDAWVFHAPEQDLVKAEFVFGNHYGKEENPLLNTMMSAMLKEGTSRMSSAEIADAIDYYGAYLMPEFSFDHSSLTLYTLNKYVTQVFPIVFDILTDATIPQDELDTAVRNNKQGLQISLEKNDFVAKRLFYQHLFGENRYGSAITVESLDALRREDLLQLYAQQMQPKNCTLFLSGNITKEVLEQAASLFGTKWQNNRALSPSNTPLIVAPTDTSLMYQEKASSLQSAIRLGKQSITRRDPDFPALQFVNTLFGGYFGSRLMQNIREDKGYTYGIGSSLVSLQHTGLFTIATQVGVEVTQATIDEIRIEIDRLHQEQVGEAEIELARNYLLGAMLGSLESVFSHVDKFKAVYFSGMDLSYYDYYTAKIHEMDATTVQQLAQKHLVYDELVTVVVGKM